MADYAGDVLKGIQALGEPLAIVKTAPGTFDTATQTRHLGSVTTYSTIGIVRQGALSVDGVEVRADELMVWVSKLLLDALGCTPVNGDGLVVGTVSSKILDLHTNVTMGYYRFKAQGLS